MTIPFTVCCVDPNLLNQDGEPVGDHLALTFSLHVSKPPNALAQVSYGKLCKIHEEYFIKDIKKCQSLQDTNKSLEELISAYNENLSALVDKHAPFCSREITL